MNLLAPKYYKDFVCIADKCQHSCCIGWEIDIDEKTMSKYSSLEGQYSENIRNSIDMSDVPHFKLTEKERCPHLNEKGLCNIILNCGEDCLCDICREHPRFYNFTNLGKEVGLGMSCEAACKLILKSDNFDEFVVLSEDNEPIEITEFDATEERNKIYQILRKDYLTLSEKIKIISDNYDIHIDDEEIRKNLENIEYLDISHKELFAKFTIENMDNKSIENELTRALAYFIYRHCSEASDFEEFFLSLNLALVCTHIISSLATKENIEKIARIISEEIEYSEDNIEAIKNSFILDDETYKELFE
jgi:lysine-N-methylase